MDSCFLTSLCIALCFLVVSSEISQLRLVSQSRCGKASRLCEVHKAKGCILGSPQNYSVLFPERLRSASFSLERVAADGLDGSMCFLVELPPMNISMDTHLSNLCLFQEMFVPHPFVRRLECMRPPENASHVHKSFVYGQFSSHCEICSGLSPTQNDVSLRTQLLKSGETVLCDSLKEASHENLSLRFCIPSENYFWRRLGALRSTTERWTNGNPWECDPHRVRTTL